MSATERDYLDRYLQSLHERTAPTVPEDEFFERFCAEQVLKSRDLDVDELSSGVVRGTNDGGVDSLYLFANGKLVQEGGLPSEYKKQREVKLHLVFVQATRSPTFSEDSLRKLIHMASHIMDLTHSVDDYAARYNPALRIAIGRFREWWTVLTPQLPKLQITFYLASKAAEDPHRNVAMIARELEDHIRSLYPCECQVEFVNAKALIELARRSRRKPLPLKFSEQLSSDRMGNAYVCLVPLEAYVDFITDEDGQRREYILAPNVRGYLGDTDINQNIRDTLIGAHDKEFWWLNNGVTIVANKIHPSTRELMLEEPRIVNGLQTSREIYNYSVLKSVKGDPRHLIVRVIETSEKHVFNQILRTTNSQTRIGKLYLHSTEDIHEKIEMAFPSFGLFYERQKNQYFDEDKERDKIVTLPYLIQALIAIVLQNPDQASSLWQ